MEIITLGKLPQDTVHEATCWNCKTRMRFQQSEGEISTDVRDRAQFITVDCPHCGAKVTQAL